MNDGQAGAPTTDDGHGWFTVDIEPNCRSPLVPEPDWAKAEVDRTTMRALQRRSDVPGLVWFGTHVALLLVSAGVVILASPLWLRIAAFAVYATVFAFSEAILHETHHRTAFRTLALNEAVHYVAGLLAFKEPIRDRWLHAAHHTYTYYTEIDPEIQVERPPRFWTIWLDFLRLRLGAIWLWTNFSLAAGKLDALTRRWVPPADHRKVVRSARVMCAFYLGVVVLAVVLHSWYPILFIFAARFAGSWLHMWVTLPQHAGLEENVRDWRCNTRTIRMNPLLRLLYWNMNYHVEHHMHPTVPFSALPKLHEAIETKSPKIYRSTFEAWSEVMPALWRLRKNPDVVPIPFARRPNCQNGTYQEVVVARESS